MHRIIVSVFAVGMLSLAGSAQAAGDAAAGKEKAAACAMCHGPNGQGTQMAPKLAGEDPAKFTQAIADFQSGKRDNAMMKAQATSLSAADTANLAAYYQSLK